MLILDLKSYLAKRLSFAPDAGEKEGSEDLGQQLYF
jgi:hypothetical protein